MQTAVATSTSPISSAPRVLPALLTAWGCFATALILLAAARWDYAQSLQFTALRNDCLIAGIDAGLGATICLAGCMYYLSRAARIAPRWYWRAPIATAIRCVMLFQLLTIALALGAAVLMIFNKPIPGTVPSPPKSTATRSPTRSAQPRPAQSPGGRGRRGGRGF